MKSKLFVCRSYYHIYSALKSSDNSSQTTILCIDYQLDFTQLSEMKSNIENSFSNIKVCIASKSYKDVRKKIENYYDEVYLFHWVAYKMPEMYIYMKFKKSNFFMIEDGVNHYGGIQKSILNKKIYLKYLVNYLIFGRKDLVLKKKVKKIYVTHIHKYPGYMLGKLELVDTLFQRNMENDLLTVFNINLPNLEKERIAIVLTQPLSEDGFISENKKIKIYKDTVNELVAKGYYVLFKSHPREKTTYTFSKRVNILNKNFPVEILNYANVKLNIAIAVSSGSLDTINASHKVKLLPEFFDILDYSKVNIDIKKLLVGF